jgi:hypothetical protein
LQSFLLKIDVTEIVVHKGHQPDAIVDLLDSDSLTRQRSAEIDFLLVDADSSAAGDKSCPILERAGEFSDAAGQCISSKARTMGESSSDFFAE